MHERIFRYLVLAQWFASRALKRGADNERTIEIRWRGAVVDLLAGATTDTGCGRRKKQ